MTRRRFLIVALVALFAASPYFGIPAWTPALATMACFLAISLMGLNLIFGVTGMLALGHAAFTALPGFASGILQNFGTSGFVSIPAGIVIAVLVARLVAEIFIRLPGIYFAIGTLGFAFVVEGLARAFPSVTGGASGLVLVFPLALDPGAWYGLSFACLVAAFVLYVTLVKGRFLRTLKLIRHDELAAEVLGVDVVRLKLRIFTVGCVYAAIGGVLLAYFTGVLVPENGGVNNSLEYLAMVIIGGAGAPIGPIIGSSGVQWLFMVTGSADHYKLLVYGVVFFLVVLFAPAGLAGLLRRPWNVLLAGFGSIAEAKHPPAQAPEPALPEPLARVGAARRGVCLQVRAASKHFGGVIAVDEVDLEVAHGEIVAVIGPNGAGKSTLFNLVSGIEELTNGGVFLHGEDLCVRSIHDCAAAIGRSFQVARLVPEMTIIENVMARLDHLPVHLGEAEKRTLAARQLGEFGLSPLADKPVRDLGLGYHKLVDLARASVGGPSLLLLDEPVVGLTVAEADHLMKMLVMLKSQGVAILVVEHNIEFIVTVADRIVVMDSGKRIATGTAAEVMDDPAVQEAYFGVLKHKSRGVLE